MSKPSDVFTDVPISEPYFFPQDELIDMDGFAWTQEWGVVVAAPKSMSPEEEKLREQRHP